MFITVEPQDGTELERLITVLLNITGVVHRLVDEAVSDAAEPHEVMSVVAERLHDALAVIPEHHSDEELAELTGILAYATVLGASELGLGDVFRPPDAV